MFVLVSSVRYWVSHWKVTPRPWNCLTNKDHGKTSRMQETLNLLMCAESSGTTKQTETDKKGEKNRRYVKFHVSNVTSHVSCVVYIVSHFACHLSLMPTARAKDPLPDNSPIMPSRLVCKDPKPEEKKKKHIIKTKSHKRQEECQYYPSTRSPQWHQKAHRLMDITT